MVKIFRESDRHDNGPFPAVSGDRKQVFVMDKNKGKQFSMHQVTQADKYKATKMETTTCTCLKTFSPRSYQDQQNGRTIHTRYISPKYLNRLIHAETLSNLRHNGRR